MKGQETAMNELSGIDTGDGTAVLSYLIDAVQMELATARSYKFTPPWDLYIFDNIASLYFATSGCYSLKVEGSDTVYKMRCGDIALLLNKRAHHLYSDIPKFRQLRRFKKMQAPENILSPRTMLIRGTFTLFENEIASLFPEMPSVILMKFNEARIFPWIMRTIMMIADESGSKNPGVRANLKHLANIILLQGIRAHLAVIRGVEARCS
jgi:hypothetical protein